MILIYGIAWFFMIFIGIANGVIRQFGYGRYMSELTAHQVSTLTGIILFGLYTWLLSLRWKLESTKQALTVGLIWLCLTVVFEFVFGHYVMKHPWSRLLHDYNLFEGRVWILVLVWITIAPYVIYKSR